MESFWIQRPTTWFDYAWRKEKILNGKIKRLKQHVGAITMMVSKVGDKQGCY